MNIPQFLLERKVKLKFKTTKEHFENLGGAYGLEMTLRNFRMIESGAQKPSPRLFYQLFINSPDSDKKDLIRAYFKSVLPTNNSKEVDEFILTSMMNFAQEENSIWNLKIPLAFYSYEQLDYLCKNRDALLFHKNVLLYRRLHESKLTLEKKKVEKLIELELISYAKPYYTGYRQIYMLPKFETSNSRDFSKGVEYVLENQNIFLNRKGNERQRMTYTMQLVDKRFAGILLDQTKKFQDWLKSFARHIPDSGSDEHTKNLVPVINISFSKVLSTKEIDELSNP